MDNVECDKAVDLEVEYSMRVEERSCSAESVKENGTKESDNDDAEWDAKSWDDALKHGSSYEPEPRAEKDVNNAGTKTAVTTHSQSIKRRTS